MTPQELAHKIFPDHLKGNGQVSLTGIEVARATKLIEEYRDELILACRDKLLEQMASISKGGYLGVGISVEPDITRVVSNLPEIMDIDDREFHYSALHYYLNKFGDNALPQYQYDPILRNVIMTLVQGGDIYGLLKQIVDNYNSLQKDYMKQVMEGQRSTILTNYPLTNKSQSASF